MKKSDKYTIIALVILGIGCVVYPHIQRYLFTIRAQNAIAEFEARIYSYRADHIRQQTENGIYTNTDIEEDHTFWINNVGNFMAFMNARLFFENQDHLTDPFNHDHPCFSMQPFGLDMNIVGILYIPVIELNVPVYMGTSLQNLTNGAAHLTHSSFPLGGESTHAVIAGHRNQTYSRVFRDLQHLTVGDEIKITNIVQTLIYEVIETRVMEPNEIDTLAIQDGRDLVTLITPYSRWGRGSRYIVVAERVIH